MFDAIKNIFRRVRAMVFSGFMQKVSDVADNANAVSNVMMNSIDLWMNMFAGMPPWVNPDNDSQAQSLGLPSRIASEVARTVTLEMGVKVAGSPMADFLMEQLKPVLKDIRSTTEYACAGGGVVFKPYVLNDTIVTEIVKANCFYPTLFDSSRKITGAFFVYRKWEGKKIYTRIEKHEHSGEKYVITNTAYVSAVEGSIGQSCSLEKVAEWAEIEPVVSLKNVSGMLFSYFKMPMANTVDADSPLGVSVYGRGESVDIIKEADKQWRRFIWEYEGGELAIHASKDAFKGAAVGNPVLPVGKERLYYMTEIDALASGGDNKLLDPWAPALRDENYGRGLNKMLMQVEDSVCISRGTFSDPTQEALTATQVKTLKQRTYAQVTDIQTALGDALDGLLYAMYCIAILYGLASDGKYDAVYDFDDSVVTDTDAERMQDKDDVNSMIMLPWEYRVKWYGDDEKTAKERTGYVDKTDDNGDDRGDANDPYGLDKPDSLDDKKVAK